MDSWTFISIVDNVEKSFYRQFQFGTAYFLVFAYFVIAVNNLGMVRSGVLIKDLHDQVNWVKHFGEQ